MSNGYYLLRERKQPDLDAPACSVGLVETSAEAVQWCKDTPDDVSARYFEFVPVIDDPVSHDAEVEEALANDLEAAQDQIEELEAEVERLREQRDKYEKGLHAARGRVSALLQDTHEYGGLHAVLMDIEDALENEADALDAAEDGQDE
jgi:DNA repair ATPase RecN